MEQTAGRLPAGWKYVLPTEAQWEYACRAGTTTIFSWGNDAIPPGEFNWDHPVWWRSEQRFSNRPPMWVSMPANPWGFFDMHGNVWEWVSDWKANYLSGAQTDPEGPASGSSRVYRGGSWNNGGLILRSAKRATSPPATVTITSASV